MLLSEPLIQIEPIAGNHDLEDPDPNSMDQFYVPRHAQGPKGFDQIPPGAPPGHIFVFGAFRIYGKYFLCYDLTLSLNSPNFLKMS